jgi:hypothetical protein
MPFRVVIQFVAHSRDFLAKGLRLFKTCEGKATLQVVEVIGSCPSIDPSSVNDIVY